MFCTYNQDTPNFTTKGKTITPRSNKKTNKEKEEVKQKDWIDMETPRGSFTFFDDDHLRYSTATFKPKDEHQFKSYPKDWINLPKHNQTSDKG